MTWIELKAKIDNMTPEQQGTDVTLLDDFFEFRPLPILSFTDNYDDILDANHPFLTTL
jgi:hypothetical protein